MSVWISGSRILAIVATVLAVTALAERIRFSAPLLLMLVGIGISFVPFIDEPRLTPEMILLGFLPPLLYAAAIRTSVIDFRANKRSIGALSVLLVVVTALGIGLITWLILPVNFAVAFAFGAVVAPPDAVAATSIARRVGLPRQLVTILEGESLVNDATAITCLRVAIAAIGGAVSAGEVTVGFLIAAGGGALVGLLVALVVVPIRRRITQPVFDTAISLIVPFAAYLPAEHLGNWRFPRLRGDRGGGRRADSRAQVAGDPDRAVAAQRTGQLGDHPVPAGEHGVPADRSAGAADRRSGRRVGPVRLPDRRLLRRRPARGDRHPDVLGDGVARLFLFRRRWHTPDYAPPWGHAAGGRLGRHARGGHPRRGLPDPGGRPRGGAVDLRRDGGDRGHAAAAGVDPAGLGPRARAARTGRPLGRPAGRDGAADLVQRGTRRTGRDRRRSPTRPRRSTCFGSGSPPGRRRCGRCWVAGMRAKPRPSSIGGCG